LAGSDPKILLPIERKDVNIDPVPLRGEAKRQYMKRYLVEYKRRPHVRQKWRAYMRDYMWFRRAEDAAFRKAWKEATVAVAATELNRHRDNFLSTSARNAARHRSLLKLIVVYPIAEPKLLRKDTPGELNIDASTYFDLLRSASVPAVRKQMGVVLDRYARHRLENQLRQIKREEQLAVAQAEEHVRDCRGCQLARDRGVGSPGVCLDRDDLEDAAIDLRLQVSGIDRGLRRMLSRPT
jgi:hypothetical protein